MNKYRVEAQITLHSGVIGLKKEQAEPRDRCLEKRRLSGTYLITSPVQFKAGEVIRLDVPATRGLAAKLTCLDDCEKAKPAETDTDGADDGGEAGADPEAGE